MTSTPETAAAFSSSVEARKAQLIERCQSLGELLVWPGRAKLDSVAWLENFRPAELPLALVLLKAVLFFNSRMLDRLFLATIGKLRRFAAPLSTEIYQRREAWENFRQSITITMMTGEIPSLADSGYIYLRCARDLAHITEDRIVSPEKALHRARANPNLPVVFVDDFVGSGDQFVKTWRRDYGNGNAFSVLNQASTPRFYCCPLFCTWAAAERIRKECPNVILVPGHLLEERYSVLSSDFFVQHSIPDFSRAIMDVSLRAGIKANVAYGYQNLGLTLMMEHCTPDATLPLFTHAEGNWNPLNHAPLMPDIEVPILQSLSAAFGRHKAEWLGDQVFQTFTKPDYFPELEQFRPCILVGGRGTGKTTVLKAMSYEGQFVLSGRQEEAIRSSTYFGLYYRANTNRVTAFEGPDLPPHEWGRLFTHYFNLLICERVVDFLQWYNTHLPGEFPDNDDTWRQLSPMLGIEASDSFSSFAEHLIEGVNKFESAVNNIGDGNMPFCSMSGAPVDFIFKRLRQTSTFKNKMFFLLLDEYENFSDQQQQIINTLIKHASDTYTFKIGVREMGWRCRTTVNTNEQLISPADYFRIDIAEQLESGKFERFAENVCRERISGVPGANLSINDLLPGYSIEEEARILDGSHGSAAKAKTDFELTADPLLRNTAISLRPLEAFLLSSWADAALRDRDSRLRHYIENTSLWNTRFDNYSYALLFALRRGKVGVRKYFCGWDTFVKLAAGNIRYCLELVEQAVSTHMREGGIYGPIPQKVQTLAAQAVGRKNLVELEGLSVHGARLTKLLLGLGRVFEIMASDTVGHAPEVNQFHLPHLYSKEVSNEEAKDCEELLSAAVMHLALLRFSGSKLGDAGETRDYDYMVHPIFSAFFVFSHRRKRKMMISPRDIVALTKNHKPAIERLLKNSGRELIAEALPDQLRLFNDYYERP